MISDGRKLDSITLRLDIQTPHLDAVAATGLQLNRFYTESMCSPSRSSLLTGRFGIHVNIQNVEPDVCNPDDPIGGYQGIPIEMTAIADMLRDKAPPGNRYRTHLVGKWDVGMATDKHSPWNRGFDSWLGYWHHSNDFWSQFSTTGLLQDEGTCDGHAVKDLWRINATFNGPAVELSNDDGCSQFNQTGTGVCVYEEDILLQEVVDVIETHDLTQPLFLIYSSHLVHQPLQVKQDLLDEFSFIDDTSRQWMHAMVNQLDTNIGIIIDTLKKTGLWENTLLVIHSDNGGVITAPVCGGNNWPLRGGKMSNFEGGIRNTALVTGGALPDQQRGKVAEGLMSIADWYATYADVAGIDPGIALRDEKAAVAGLPSIDSMSCWSMISGQADTCRSEIPIGDTTALRLADDGDALVGALLQGDYKRLLGPANKNHWVYLDYITGPLWPNASAWFHNGTIFDPDQIAVFHPRVCDRTLENGCLFDIRNDVQESVSLAQELPELFHSMLERIDEWQETVYSPVRGERDPRACEAAAASNNYWNPWIHNS